MRKLFCQYLLSSAFEISFDECRSYEADRNSNLFGFVSVGVIWR